MIRILLVVLACTGCDKLLSLNDITPQPVHDAGIDGDAGPLKCSQLAVPPFVCADFDETPPVAYEYGTPHMLPTSANAVSRPPGVSPLNALWIDASTGGYTFTDMSQTATTKLEASFELDVERYDSGNGTVSIVALSLNNADCSPCRVEIQLDPSGGPGLIVAAYWPGGGYDHHPLSATPAPGAFVHVEVAYDLAMGQASARLGAAQAIPFAVLSSSQPGLPSSEVGAGVRPGAIGGPLLAIDDLVVSSP